MWALLPLAAALSACDDFGFRSLSGQGELRWIIESEGPATRASAEIPDTNDFILRVSSAEGKVLYEGPYGESPESLLVDAGSYTVGIRSIEPDEFEFHMENDIQVKTSYDCYHEGIEAVADNCIAKMSKFNKVYLTFDIDGLRLDAADVLDQDFMRQLRGLADSLKEDFWLMGEVIHGEYGRWVNEQTLHSVTNYALHKALYSGHNDHNYFEIAHTIRRQRDMGLGDSVHLYDFVDNHDVERIMTKLNDKRHFLPVHVLLYTLPGIPSVYYGSEFGLEGRKEWGTDASLRPALSLAELGRQENPWLQIIRALGDIYKEESALWYGEYREADLTNTRYAFLRGDLLVTVTNSNQEEFFDLELNGPYTGALHGRKIHSENGRLKFTLEGNSAEIWIPASEKKQYQPIHYQPQETVREEVSEEMPQRAEPGKSPEEMSVEELQAEVLARLAANGPVTDQMKREVKENVYRDSLLNWVKSFR